MAVIANGRTVRKTVYAYAAPYVTNKKKALWLLYPTQLATTRQA